jgi:hypothetical protein
MNFGLDVFPSIAIQAQTSEGTTISNLSPVDSIQAPVVTPEIDYNSVILLGVGIIVLVIVAVVVVPKLFKSTGGVVSAMSVLALVAGTIGLPYAVRVVNKPTQTATEAFLATAPKQVFIDSLSSTEFVVRWQTDTPVLGAVRYGTSDIEINQAAFGLDPLQKNIAHEVIVGDLEPGHTYYIEIISGSNRFNQYGRPLMITLPQ